LLSKSNEHNAVLLLGKDIPQPCPARVEVNIDSARGLGIHIIKKAIFILFKKPFYQFSFSIWLFALEML
jgi:hypothetical protein